MSRVKWEVYNFIWTTWHCRLRRFFDRIAGKHYFGTAESRPWWHLCCNGDAGGWRTKFCHHFDCYVNTHPREWERFDD